MIAVIDYGLGNLGSIANMLKAIGEKCVITNDGGILQSADKLILPGVGAFDAGMDRIDKYRLADVIKYQAVERKKPLLGICLGMQLLGRKSEEGNRQGLGLIPFESRRFQFEEKLNLKIPHMGWDIVNFKQKNPILDGLYGTQRYYFVHSFHAVCDDSIYQLMSCDYGYEFAAAVVKDNVIGVQFHPEKSHDFGMALLKNFAEKC